MDNILNVAIYKDGNNTILVFKNTTAETEDIIRNLVSTLFKNTEETEIEHLEPVVNEPESIPEVPAFMHDAEVAIEDVVDCGAYVVANIKKYAGQNKTIAQIFDEDEKWLRWVAENYHPRKQEAKDDVEAIKNFLSTK